METQTAKEELAKSVNELQFHLNQLRDAHGSALYDLKNSDGSYIVTPILVALVNARAKLYGITL